MSFEQPTRKMHGLVSVVFRGPKLLALRGAWWLWNNNRRLAVGIVAVISVVKIRRALKRRQKR